MTVETMRMTRTVPTPALHSFIRDTIRETMETQGYTPEQIGTYLEEREQALSAMSAEEIGDRLLREMPRHRFHDC